MQAYVVGGAVRDALLGRPVHDHDWVVVGATPEQMLAAGYTPVGKDFPVFLHPQTHEEYALARTERKTAPGYHGFVFHAAPEVTLEQDLQRRDLTINAIARAEDGTLIDPCDGQRDLAAKVLRHVSAAFAEDPVRILRLARFAARFPDFSVAPETLALMRQMVEAGEVDALVAERVWQELATGLMETRPSRMLEVLRDCGALARLLPEVDRLWGVPQRPEFHPEVDTGAHLLLVLDQAARLQAPLSARFAALCHDLGKGTTPPEEWPRHIAHEARGERLTRELCARLKPPAECSELALVVAREHTHIHQAATFGAAAVLRLLERCDAFRRPERFELALLACEADARGRLGLEHADYPSAPLLRQALQAGLDVDTARVAAEAQARGAKGPAIGEAIHLARANAVSMAI
ncbi:multifunctional CCA addition/repair protein [Ideonella sp. B7]|uniref:multifunctional CCA addition/repair protein n=1 Tax=Ideonella benzenivorans TaxID=2831643 RepID=UPI001CEC2044|nr:multifunctional CCA addition/repair protein [Ideonella benzenivorans]MCA6217250.1 multifunctional CCA addition/repair protein [Ideonella benzenivorans]